jgi:hypothetical protein
MRHGKKTKDKKKKNKTLSAKKQKNTLAYILFISHTIHVPHQRQCVIPHTNSNDNV